MVELPVLGNCYPLPPETTLTVGFHPETRAVLIMFNHPAEGKGFYWPVTLEDAKRMAEMLQQLSRMGERRLDS